MTITLRKQLGLWFGGALVCVVALQSVRVLAQPKEKLTAEEVSRKFGLWLNGNVQLGMRSNPLNDLLTRQNQNDLAYYHLDRLLTVMSLEYATVTYESQVVSEKLGKKVVRLAPLKDSSGREFVCVKEDGGYKVDIVATYGHWNNLKGAALAERIFDVSGGVLPNLPRTPKLETSICQSNMKQISLGLMQYIQDYDEFLPPTRGWNKSIEPYIKSRQLYNCPSARPASYGYAYNQSVALKYQGFDKGVVTFFDSRRLSANAVGGQNDIANRHRLTSGSGANMAFADGHIKFIGSSYKWNDSLFTFTAKRQQREEE